MVNRWLIDRSIIWVVWLVDWMVLVFYRLIVFFKLTVRWLAIRLVSYIWMDGSIDCSIGCTIGLLSFILVNIGRYIDWLVDCSIGWFCWSLECLLDWLTGWLICWLAFWLVGWFIALLVQGRYDSMESTNKVYRVQYTVFQGTAFNAYYRQSYYRRSIAHSFDRPSFAENRVPPSIVSTWCSLQIDYAVVADAVVTNVVVASAAVAISIIAYAVVAIIAIAISDIVYAVIANAAVAISALLLFLPMLMLLLFLVLSLVMPPMFVDWILRWIWSAYVQARPFWGNQRHHGRHRFFHRKPDAQILSTRGLDPTRAGVE